MGKVISRDGTHIDFDCSGEGPPLILTLGAFNDRTTGAPLAGLLKSDFTVVNYDRRGRGKSGDTTPYAIDREIEDLDALIQEVGGSAFLLGYSSGGLLALHAASKGLSVPKLVLYEAPVMGHDAGLVPPLADLVATGRLGDAVEYFQSKFVGMPEQVVNQLRHAPFRPYLESIAHTTVYDAALVCEPPQANDLALITIPTLVITGSESENIFRQANESLAASLPQGQYLCLEGQSHHLDAPVLAPVVRDFLQEGLGLQ
jgi:pimeloyl-ACP methyl ester carboxylesterase